MSHFYGSLTGQSKTNTTRRGSKNSGISCQLASWSQSLQLSIWHNEETEEDHYLLEFIPWQGQGKRQEITSGILS